jgi:hypothetical protein
MSRNRGSSCPLSSRTTSTELNPLLPQYHSQHFHFRLRCRGWVKRKRDTLWTLSLMTIRCDHCRRSLGLIAQRYWRMQFCSADCVEAYQRRLDDGTKAKLRHLDVVARDMTTERRIQRDWTTNKIETRSAKLNAPLRRSPDDWWERLGS